MSSHLRAAVDEIDVKIDRIHSLIRRGFQAGDLVLADDWTGGSQGLNSVTKTIDATSAAVLNVVKSMREHRDDERGRR